MWSAYPILIGFIAGFITVLNKRNDGGNDMMLFIYAICSGVNTAVIYDVIIGWLPDKYRWAPTVLLGLCMDHYIVNRNKN